MSASAGASKIEVGQLTAHKLNMQLMRERMTDIIKSFEIRKGNLEAVTPEGAFTIAVGASTSQHVMTIAWPHLDNEERELAEKFRRAGLPLAGITVRSTEGKAVS